MNATTPAAEPLPFTPPDCDLRDFPFMQLDVARLRDSGAASLPDPEAFRACVLAWCVSWHQVPAASLPDDDLTLSILLGYGRTSSAWQAVRAAGGLHGWVKCSDGRLYHPVVAEKAKEAWGRKQAMRERSQKGNRARWGERDEQKTASRKDAKTVQQGRKKHPTGTENPSHKDTSDVPQGDEQDREGDLVQRAERTKRPPASHKDGKAVPQGHENDPSRTENPSFKDPYREGEGEGESTGTETSSLPRRATAPVSDEPEPPDAATLLWREGVPILRRLTGKSDDACRAVLGGLRKSMKDDCPRLLLILQQARDMKPSDPIGWITAAAQNRGRKEPPRQPGKSYAGCL